VLTPHPADPDRRLARDALASMPPARRAFREALHAEFFPPRADGGMVYRLLDVQFYLALGTRHGLDDGRAAEGLGVPAEYLAVLREARGGLSQRGLHGGQ
jgi:hypothetical protein